jgi:quinol monooxygenase YgiN
MVAVVWQFEIHADKSEAFERLYGADGEWTRLSRRSRSFLGSSFLKDIAHEDRYLLVEYWSEMVVYERHVAAYSVPMKALERERERYVRRIEPIGVFTALDVPDRMGPTWSRRSGPG